MALKPVLAVVLLSALALAGCSGDGGDDGKATSTSTSGSRSSSSATPTVAPNHPPSGSLSASVQAGGVPLQVNFTVAGTDPDGDAVNWTLAFGDGNSTTGADLPGNATHTYTAAGAYNATLTLDDGRNQTAYSVAVNATAAADTASQQVSGEWTAGAAACPHVAGGAFEDQSAGDLATGGGVTWGYFEVDPATWGATWTVLAASDTGALIEMDFWDTSGAYMEYNSGEYGAPFSGTVPDDAGYGFVFPCGAGPGTFEYTAAFA